MRGDRLLIEPHHREAAETLATRLKPRWLSRPSPLVVAIAGESGSGKSELTAALADALRGHDVSSLIIQQDDYFVYPPKTNDRKRRSDIAWVGPQEVRLYLLDAHLAQLAKGADSVDKPLVFYDEDRIGEETLRPQGADILIAEGTYTSLLVSVDVRVFIDRTVRETRTARIERAREAQDAFLERVLAIEHEVISTHRDLADYLITSDYSVEELVPES